MNYVLQHEFDNEPSYICLPGDDEPVVTFAPGNYALAVQVLQFMNSLPAN